MAIISSTYSLESVQADGRRPCIEVHTDNIGHVYLVEWLADANADYASVMNARAVMLAQQIKDRELHDALFSFAWDYVLTQATNTELAAYVREIYRNGSKDQLAIVAARVLEWIANGRFTDTQVRNVFGLSLAQWNTLKTKMQTLVNNYNVVLLAVGE